MKLIFSIFVFAFFVIPGAAQTKPVDFAALEKTISDAPAATKTPVAAERIKQPEQ
jgi:hypothetical protein